MNTENVKRFVKEHKKEIIIGVVCEGIGVHYGKKHYGVSKDEMKLVKDLRTFDTVKGNGLFKDIYEVQRVANRCRVFIPKCEKHITDISEAINGAYDVFGGNQETTGFIVFTK